MQQIQVIGLKEGDKFNMQCGEGFLSLFVERKDSTKIHCRLTPSQIESTSTLLREILMIDGGPTWVFSTVTGEEIER